MRHLFLLLAVFLLVKHATAEEVTLMLDEIVVTASRIGQKHSDPPVTISVIDEKEIEKVNYRNQDEILRRIPNVSTHDFGSESELSANRIPIHFTQYTRLLIDGVQTSSYGHFANAACWWRLCPYFI